MFGGLSVVWCSKRGNCCARLEGCAGMGAPNAGARSRYKRSLTKLALEVHWTSNLSEFPLRVAFAR